MYIYTHRGVKKHIQECLDKMRIDVPGKEQVKHKIMDHDKPCIWVSEGYANIWNYIWSGMIGNPFSKNPKKKYYITFSSIKKAKRPSGIKRIFGKSQCVFEDTIFLNKENIIKTRLE